MYFILIILLLLFIFVLLLFYEYLNIHLIFDTNTEQLSIDLNWFGSFLRAKVIFQKFASNISIHLFGIRIYSKAIKQKNKKKFKWNNMKALEFKDAYANIYYGLNNPFATGVVSGIIQIIRSFFRGIYINQYPDFIPDNEYVYINSGAKLNIGRTALNIIRIKLSSRRKRRELLWSK